MKPERGLHSMMMIIIIKNESYLGGTLALLLQDMTTIQCYHEVLVDCFIMSSTQEKLTVKMGRF